MFAEMMATSKPHNDCSAGDQTRERRAAVN
jgi:hypothetical protein